LTGGRSLRHHSRESGEIAASRRARFVGLSLRFAAGSVANTLQTRARRRSGSAGVDAEDPVFILGHYRSGTTLVHKLLVADPQFDSPHTFDILFPACPRWLEPIIRAPLQGLLSLLRVRQPFFNDTVVRLRDPNEFEPVWLSTGSYWSTYWGYLFPRNANCYLNRFVEWPDDETRAAWMRAYRDAVSVEAWRSGGRRMVLKDPPNTGRVRELLELYPAAKFIHVVRDPREVFLSMRALWRDVIERRYALQVISGEERDQLIFRHYRTLMERWMAQRELIPAGALFELRYESFMPDPLAGIRGSYSALGLGDFAAVEPNIRRRLVAEQKYRPVARSVDPDTMAMIDRELGEWRARLGYV